MDQLLFNRPFPGYAQYRGPVTGFYMCGSGTHPGGGVMAAPGANAAREILFDLRKPSSVPEGRCSKYWPERQSMSKSLFRAAPK